MRVASAVAIRKVSISRSTSPRASLIGLPASMHRLLASSSRRSPKRRTQCSSTSRRASGGNAAIAALARCAESMASHTASASAIATRVARLPLNLSNTSRPVLAATGRLAR